MDTEKPAFGIPIVVALTFVVMSITGDRFDNKRFAIPVSIGIGIVVSITDALIFGQGQMAQTIYTAVLRGITVGFGAVGAHSAYKNYSKKEGETPL